MANTANPMTYLFDNVNDDTIALAAVLSRHVDTGAGCSCDVAVRSGIAHRLHVAQSLLSCGVTLPSLPAALAVAP